MSTPQGGIFALGTASHAYLEFDGSAGREGRELVAAISSLREPRTTMGGVNLVAGFRPELWSEAAPDDSPADLNGFNEELRGIDGFAMPATQHDAVLWLSGSAYDVVFEVARNAIAALGLLASVAEETSSWPYRQDRDLTGFIDGTENPTLTDAPELVLIRREVRGRAGRSCSCRSGRTTRPPGKRFPSRRRSRRSGERRRTASSSTTDQTTRTWQAPIRTGSGRSSAGTCRTER